MIDTSSKRLSKIKKKLKKNQTSDYYFLISSLQRDSNKQNHASNHFNLNKTSLKNSIQLKKSSMVNSFDNSKNFTHEKQFDNYQILNNSRERTKINIRNTHSTNHHPPFFENVKFLKNSRILEEHQPNQQNKFNQVSKGYQKNIQFSQNLNSKFFNQTKQPKSNKFTQNLGDSLEQKVEAYVEFVDQLLDEIFAKFRIEKSNSFSRKKCLLQTLGKELLREIKKTPQIQTMKNLSKSIEVSNFTSFPSKVMSRELQRSMTIKEKGSQNCLKKKIQELSQENRQLTQLISEHERKNIKMFVKMNENESKEIERCKKYLSNLYDKYKMLEKSLLKQNEKYKTACQENKEAETKITGLQVQNQSLREQLQKFKEMFEEMNSQTLSKLSFQEDIYSNTIFNFNIMQKNSKQGKNPKINQSLIHQQSQQINSKMDKSFITKRDKAASCLSSHANGQGQKHKEDEMMSCSTITKTKNMKKKKPQAPQKASVGVNLKDQFNQIVEDELNSLKKQIQSIKVKLNDQITSKISLQKQLNSLELSLKKSKQKLQKREDIISEQLQEIQKLIEANKRLENQLRFEKANDKKSAGMSAKCSSKGVQEVFQQIKRLNQIKTTGHKESALYRSGWNESEYRIISMQAGLIESFIQNSE